MHGCFWSKKWLDFGWAGYGSQKKHIQESWFFFLWQGSNDQVAISIIYFGAEVLLVMTCKESLWRNDLLHCMLPGWCILRLLNSFFIYFMAVDIHPLILATQIWWCPIAEMVMCGWVGVWDQINLQLQWGYTIWTMEVRHSAFRKSMLILTLSTVYNNLYHIICWRYLWIRGYTLKALWQPGKACSMNYSFFWWNGISPLGLLCFLQLRMLVG